MTEILEEDDGIQLYVFEFDNDDGTTSQGIGFSREDIIRVIDEEECEPAVLEMFKHLLNELDSSAESVH